MIDATNFDALTFDVYGTLLNWEPEIANFLADWAASGGRSIEQTDLLSAYDRVRQPLQEHRPALRYPEILERTLLQLGKEFDLAVPTGTLEQFSEIAATHKPFPDSVDALNELRHMGFKLAALSNIDEASFAKATTSAGISFDVVVTGISPGGNRRGYGYRIWLC